jgi:DNA (cytosine-5)-methyltransferase 1
MGYSSDRDNTRCFYLAFFCCACAWNGGLCLSEMIHISTFSGIGGFDRAAEWMGWKNIASCEINPFSRKVLEYYWPESYHHDDIHTLTYKKLDEELKKRFGAQWRSDDIVLSGGFPCQPYSTAGKRLGKEDDRHLWPEMLRLIRELRPTWVVGENVRGLINWNEGLVFEEVQADLEAEGYEVQPFLLPAAGVGAPHRRDRVWFVAYNPNSGIKSVRQKRENSIYETKFTTNTSSNRRTRKWQGVASKAGAKGLRQAGKLERRPEGLSGDENATNSIDPGLQGNERTGTHGERGRAQTFRPASKQIKIPTWDRWPTEPPICSRDDGISSGLAGITFSKHRNESIKAYGNAVVPQVVYPIFKAIEQYSKENEMS